MAEGTTAVYAPVVVVVNAVAVCAAVQIVLLTSPARLSDWLWLGRWRGGIAVRNRNTAHLRALAAVHSEGGGCEQQRQVVARVARRGDGEIRP